MNEKTTCDYGCGREAKFIEFPVFVNGRMYSGPVCEKCAKADFDSIEESLESMKGAYDENALEAQKIDELIVELRRTGVENTFGTF